jgi:transposase
MSIKAASEKLNINYSTGKLIIKKYKKYGHITIFSDEAVEKAKETDEISRGEKESDK